MIVDCIISGGQTGADRGGLMAAKALGLPTGGYAPKDYMTEYGPDPDLCTLYDLMEHESSDYRERTKDNVRLSHGTVIFGKRSRGTNCTEEACRVQGKPMLWMPSLEYNPKTRLLFRSWIRAHSIKVLNVAGNRESKSVGIAAAVSYFLQKSLKG